MAQGIFQPPRGGGVEDVWKHDKYQQDEQGRILEEVDAVKYLGVTFTYNMEWKKHIEKTAVKGNRMLGF